MSIPAFFKTQAWEFLGRMAADLELPDSVFSWDCELASLLKDAYEDGFAEGQVNAQGEESGW